MKKQNEGKKGLKWLVPVCILAVLAIVGGILGFGLGTADKPGPVEQIEKVYWNVDGETYRSQESSRFVDSDGYIYMSFACDGEQLRVPVADTMLAAAIDALEVTGLVFDQDGVVVDYKRVEDFTDGIIANKYYVTSVEGSKVVCNSSVSLKGYDVTFEITENTGVWDVGSVGITCGIPGSVNVNDRVLVIRDYDGTVSHVFVIPFTPPDDIYWNVERKYDSTSKRTTRQMDPTGTYTFLLAINGEQITVRTRDYEIANEMDTMAAKCFGLEFDENGYVNKVIHAGTAAGGGSCASWYHVSLLQDNHMEAFKVGTASTFSGTLSDDVKIYDVSGMSDFVGQPTDLRVGDQVHCLRDSMGRVCVVFVVSRIADSEIYWNVERKWDSKTSTSTRTPDRNGWYYVTVAVRGKQITVKTQDKAIVEAIDGRAAKCFGLKLNGDVIEKFYTPNAVTGGGTFASWYDITAMDGKVITVKKAETGDIRVGTLTDDCEIYNVSANASLVGEVTQLKVGDRVHTLKDLDGNICVAYVVTRFEDLPTYYNLSRKWDSTKETTTRTPDAEGYYVFEMAYKGKQVTVKTKDRSIASDIDSQAAKCVALRVVNGIVYKAIHPSNTVACKGGPTSSYTYVTSLTKYSFKTQKIENGKVTKTYDETIASNCKVYNVSDNVVSHKGEETTLQKGDFVHCLKNADNQVCLIYVLTRFEDLDVYYNLDRHWDATAQTTKRTPDAEGLYSFRMAYDGKEVTVKTASLEVANAIDSQAAKVVGIEFDKAGLAVKAIHAKGTLECKGGIGVSYATVTKIEGNQVTTYKSDNDTTTTFTIAKAPNVFNVSTNYEKNQGERTTLRVGDFIHCLKNADGHTYYVYVMSRTYDLGVYYNLDRKWNDKTAATTRTPDADGLYSFRMAYEGKEVTVKTASEQVANAIDSQVAKVVGIQFDSKGLAVMAIHAKETVICKGGIGVSYATVTKIEGDQVTTYKSDTDVTNTFTVSENANIFNVSKDFEQNQGERTTLRVGDFVHCLKGADGKTNHMYIMSRALVMDQAEHTCQHVTENVTWYEWDGKSAISVGGYYVLTQDAQLDETVTIEKNTQVTICLNGHTVTSEKRFFKVYGTLNICDHKDAQGNYQGKLSSAYSDTLDAEGKVVTKAYGSLAYLYNADASSEMNIYGGIFEHTGSLNSGALVYIANKSDNEKNTATFNLYDGVLTGGTATSSGGAVYVSNLGSFAMYGGTITDCSAATGGAVGMLTEYGKIRMEGGTITNCTSTGNGAGISVESGSFTMSGGTITGNTATGSGGGVNIQGGQFVMTGGSLDGNKGNEGGNLRINKAGTVTLKSDARVHGGSAKNGGNITMFGKLTVMDNAQITGGSVIGQGSAISVFSNHDDAQVELKILGGTVDGSIRYDSNKGQSVVLRILGGSVDTVNFKNNNNATVERQLYVGGTAKVKNITLDAGKRIQIDEAGLEDTASIGVSMTNGTDPFTTITDGADETCFHAVDEENYHVENRNNDLYLVSKAHVHCVCGGHITNVGDHTECDGTVQWTAWDGTTALADGGHYYVYDADGDGKVTVSAVKEIKANWNVSICLNGVTVEGTGSRIFLLRGGPNTTALNICDCHEESQWGSLISSHNGVAPLIHSYNNGAGPVLINIFGGNFRSTETSASYGDHAGLIRLGNTTSDAAGAANPGVLNMYAGHLSGGSGKSGGNLYISNGCAFNMYGGSITGGYASNEGGNVIICSSATVYLTGNVNISGSVAGGNLYLANNAVLQVGDLADTALVGITMGVPGQFAAVTDLTDAQRFTSDNDKYTVYNQEGRLSLVSNHKHCVCMNNQQEHSCVEDTIWLELTQKNVTELFTLVGSYYNMNADSMNLYLGDNVDMAYPIEILDGQSLQLCLNGHTLSHSAAKSSTIRLHGDMGITDCSQDMTGTVTSNRKGESPTIYILNRRTVSTNVYTYHTPTLNLYAGNLTADDQDASQKAGVLQVGNVVNPAKDDNYATFNMYGGKIYGGVASSGGNVYVETAVGVFNMYGGEISGGTATGNGGNVYVNKKQMNMYGGIITGGTAGKLGQDIYVSKNGNMTLGGTANITELYLESGKTLTVVDGQPLTTGAAIGVAKAALEAIVSNVTDQEIAKYFSSTNAAWEVVYDEETSTLKLVEKTQ